MGGGGLIEMAVTACVLVAVMRRISKMEKVVIPDALPPPPPQQQQEEKPKAAKITFELPASSEQPLVTAKETEKEEQVPAPSTPSKPAMDVSQMPTPSFIASPNDDNALLLSTPSRAESHPSASNGKEELDFYARQTRTLSVDSPLLHSGGGTNARQQLQPQLQPTPSWMKSEARQQANISTPLSANKIGEPAWKTNTISPIKRRTNST